MHTHMRGAWRALAVGGAAIICGCRSGGSSAPPQTNSAPVPPASTAATANTASTASAAPPPSATQSFDGYTITMKLVVAPDTMPVMATMKIADGQVRMEMGDLMQLVSRQGGESMLGMADAAPMMAGGFVLMQAGAKMTVVMPSVNMGMTMDMGALLGGGPGGTMVMKDAQMTVDDLGAGEQILGHATRKYRVRQQYTMITNILGQSDTAVVDQSSELWTATGVDGAEAAMKALSNVFSSLIGLDAAMKEFAAKLPPGVALRTITTGTKPDGTRETTTMETTEIKKATFDAAEFGVPAGMQLMDIGAMMSGRGRGGN